MPNSARASSNQPVRSSGCSFRCARSRANASSMSIAAGFAAANGVPAAVRAAKGWAPPLLGAQRRGRGFVVAAIEPGERQAPEQQDQHRSAPQQQRPDFERRPEQDKIAIASADIGDDLIIAVAALDPLAHHYAQ